MSIQSDRPSIPVTEYPHRWNRVQAMMSAMNLDLVLAYADDRATFGAAHARWLADFPVHFEPVLVLLAAEGSPVMLVGPKSDQYALLRGQVSDVRILREFTHPDEDYPFSTMQSFADILSDIGLSTDSVGHVGIGGSGLMGRDVRQALESALPQAEWHDVESNLCAIRAQKTPAEIEVVRYAYRIAEIGFQTGVDAIGVGVTEREVAAEIESAMRRAGAEGTGIDTIVASGANSRPILARSTFRSIQMDEMVLLTVAPRYEGYHAAIGRPVLVGDAGKEISDALETAVEAQRICAAALRPGIEGREVEALGRKAVEAGNLERFFLYSGVHSVGVIEFEPPIFGPSSPACLEEDMVISMDIPLFNAPWGGLRIEDGYLITAVGSEPLHSTPYRIEK